MGDHFTIINGKIRFDGNCTSTRSFCGAVCCKNTIVLLSEEEKLSGKYDYQKPTEGCECSTCQLMRSTNMVSLSRVDSGCIYLDGVGQCSIYEDRPSRCREYKCERTWWNLTLRGKEITNANK